MPNSEQSTAVGEGGLPKVVLVAADGARAEVYLHGAHVTSWIPAGDTERLFLSSRSAFGSGSAIRGGVPVIFPQFANEGPLPKHGFVRNMPWQVVSVSPHGAEVAEATLRLSSSPATEAIWPHAFVAELGVAVRAQSLDIELSVVNSGSDPFTFNAALHTYLRVADARQTFVSGLAGHSYRDSAAGGVRRDDAERLAIAGEIDRVYLDVSSLVKVEERDRATNVEMDGFTDVVVWNPGSTKSAALPDMEPDDYLRMLCVEAAAVGTPVMVARGARWSGSQRLRTPR
jgi:glucose-6-phosphate 1-epimerase